MRSLTILSAFLVIHFLALSQNVGIGIPTPLFKLDVRNGSINTDSVYRISGVTVLSVKGTHNLFVGERAGLITSGNYNTFAGYAAGFSNTTGYENTFVGTAAGYSNASGWGNSFFGRNAGANFSCPLSDPCFGNSFFGSHAGYNSRSSGNSLFGREAGYNNTGSDNCFFGSSSGYSNGGYANSFYGTLSGYNNSAGRENSFFGFQSGYRNISGSYNSIFGSNSGWNSFSGMGGDYNSFYGSWSGSPGSFNSFFGSYVFSALSATGVTLLGAYSSVENELSNSTAIGYRATVSASNSLVLGSINGVNSATASTNVGIGLTAPQAPFHVRSNSGSVPQILIEEDANDYARLSFQNTSVPSKFWTVAGLTHTTNANARLNFFYHGVGDILSLRGDGNAMLMGTLTHASDGRYKKNITPITNSLSALMLLSGYQYNWKDDQMDRSTQIGLLAQEVQKVFPELVKENEEGLLSVNYVGLIPVLLTALKEQQQQFEVFQKNVEHRLRNCETKTNTK